MGLLKISRWHTKTMNVLNVLLKNLLETVSDEFKKSQIPFKYIYIYVFKFYNQY